MGAWAGLTGQRSAARCCTQGQAHHFRNLAEVPLFVDSKASRCIQLADLVAWATWRKYEIKDGRFFDQLVPKFDSDGGVIHGLVHYGRRDEPCFCPACHSRRARDDAKEADRQSVVTLVQRAYGK